MSIETIPPVNSQMPTQAQQAQVTEKKVIATSAVDTRAAPVEVNANKSGDVLRQQAELQAGKNKAKQEVSQEELEKAVSNLNQFFQVVRRELQFAVDDKTGHTLITVKDSDSDQTIRQIPNEEVLALARNIADHGELSLIQEEA